MHDLLLLKMKTNLFAVKIHRKLKKPPGIINLFLVTNLAELHILSFGCSVHSITIPVH